MDHTPKVKRDNYDSDSKKGVAMSALKRKNFLVDEKALRRAKKILRAKTDSDAVRQAISLAIFKREVLRGYDKAAGKFPHFLELKVG